MPKEGDTCTVNLVCYQHHEPSLFFILHFLPEFPKKLVENDGRKLARHIKNRGRPTEQTWQKYRESKRRREVLAGNNYEVEYEVRSVFFQPKCLESLYQKCCLKLVEPFFGLFQLLSESS